jgi:hypothetical protein
MYRFRGLWLGAALMLTVSAVPVIITGPSRSGVVRLPGAILSRKAGQAFCPAVPLAYRSVVIPSGRCYLMAVMRDPRGMFLAFAPDDSPITPGRFVRLDTPAGPKLMARLLLVPIPTYSFLAPMNTILLVSTQIEDAGMHFSIQVVETLVPNLVVTLDVLV